MSFLLELNNKIEFAKNRIAEAEREVKDRQRELKELQTQAWYCQECGKYYPKSTTGKSQQEVTTVETVYHDAGYGDDDELANVTRLVTFIHCPVCGQSHPEGPGRYLRESNRRTRR